MRAEVDSPTYHGGLWRKGRAAIVDPARLAWGLKAAAESLGVRIYEHTKATKLEHDGIGVLVHTPFAKVRAGRVALGTNAFPPLLRRMRHYIVPVYDYAMVTEPLSPERLASVGWANRQGLSDYANQFHYYRLTEDNRILWGGYDAVYYFGGKVDPALEWRPETFARLSQHFFTAFPQLEGVEFTNAWGGAIDTCTRFCVFWDTAMRGKVAYAAGYTGLGVCSTRFGAEVLVDLLDGPPDRAHRAGVRPQEAAAVPAGADQVRRHPADPLVPRPGRPPAAAVATPGSACSTASASASTARRPVGGLRLYPGAMSPASSVADVADALAQHQYLPDEGLATAIYLAIRLHRPLLLEGEAGVGKTEVAKVLSRWTGGELIRLQCYEGIDASQAVYEWDYSRQLLHLRAAEATGEATGAAADKLEDELYSERFLVKRPLLRAIDRREGPAPVLLIDEVDRADDEFEAFLLEVLSDYQITVPELGTFRAADPPVVVITSNRTRDVHDALKRRCLYHWVEHPDFEREVAIVQLRAPEVSVELAREVAAAVEAMRAMGLYKPPGRRRDHRLGAVAGRARRAAPRRGHRGLDPGHGPEVPRGPGAGPPARCRRPREAGLPACRRPGLTGRPADGRPDRHRPTAGGCPSPSRACCGAPG